MRFNNSRFVTLGCFLLAGPAIAQFSPGPNPITGTVTGTQTLSGGVGTVDSSGEIRIDSGSSLALSMFGTSTLINEGTIQTLGTGRAIDSNSGIANLSIENRGLISSVSSDAFRVNTNSAVDLTNFGTIRVTAGGQAIDWAAITTASNRLDNRRGGVIAAVGEDAVRPGANGRVINEGSISATPAISGGVVSGSDGIDLRTLSGIRVFNSGSIGGRHGIATDGANIGPSEFFLQNTSGFIQGLNGSGLNIDGVSASVRATVNNGGVIRGGVMAGATLGDGDGIDVDGYLQLDNFGGILGLGARGGTNNAEGVAAGGGQITNRMNALIIGSTLLEDAPDGDTSRAGNGILIDDSNGGNAIAQTTVRNDGLIQGRSGFGIKIIGTFNDSITNGFTGTIRGAGTGAAIQMGDGDDLLINRGTIISDIGNAIDLEGGNDSVVFGDGSVITGDVSGGSGNNYLAFNEGEGGTVTYAGVLSNFAQVSVNSGEVTLSGANQYTGLTRIAGGAPEVGGATLVLDGADRVAAASGLSLFGDATLELVNVTGASAQTFSSLTLDGRARFDLGRSSLTFNSLESVTDGSRLSVVNWQEATSPDYAFRFLGDLGASEMFLALIDGTTINGHDAIFSFDGVFTNVSAVPLPGALVLLASGLGLLARRRRSSSDVYAVGNSRLGERHARRTQAGLAENS